MSFHCCSPLPSLPCFVCLLGIVPRKVTVEKSSDKFIACAKLKKGSECRARRSHGSIINIGCTEVDSLSIFKMHGQVGHCGIALVNWKLKNSPHSLITADVAVQLVKCNLIIWVNCNSSFLHLKNCLVTTLVHIFTNVLDRLHRVTVFDVDVCIEDS